MRIDPVYVLSPRPQPPSIPTRRAFLIATGAFVAGSAVGGACGYSMGARRTPTDEAASDAAAAAPSGEVELKSTGDAELDYWRRLAVQAPLDELFEKAVPFLVARVGSYPQDLALWRGVERIAHEVVQNPSRLVTEVVVASVIGQIEGTARPASPSLRDLVPALRRRREQIRRGR